MLESALSVAGGLAICVAALVVLAVMAVVIYALVIRSLARVRVPKGVEVLRFDEYPEFPWYVDTGRPQRIDLSVAKTMSNALEFMQRHMDFVFGDSQTVYFATASDPKGLGVADERGFIYVFSEAALLKARRGENIDTPRLHMKIHQDALSPA